MTRVKDMNSSFLNSTGSSPSNKNPPKVPSKITMTNSTQTDMAEYIKFACNLFMIELQASIKQELSEE